jgi:hypothetical protein
VITSLIKSKEITPIPSTPNHRLIEDVKDYIGTILLLKGIVMLYKIFKWIEGNQLLFFVR